MKRDWELIKQIFADVENDEDLEDKGQIYAETHNDSSDYLRHLELLADAGCVKGVEIDFVDNAGHYKLAMTMPRLTMEGYDFKEVLENTKLWRKIRDMAAKAGVRLSWMFIQSAMPVAIKSLF